MWTFRGEYVATRRTCVERFFGLAEMELAAIAGGSREFIRHSSQLSALPVNGRPIGSPFTWGNIPQTHAKGMGKLPSLRHDLRILLHHLLLSLQEPVQYNYICQGTKLLDNVLSRDISIV